MPACGCVWVLLFVFFGDSALAGVSSGGFVCLALWISCAYISCGLRGKRWTYIEQRGLWHLADSGNECPESRTLFKPS